MYVIGFLLWRPVIATAALWGMFDIALSTFVQPVAQPEISEESNNEQDNDYSAATVTAHAIRPTREGVIRKG